MRSSSTRRPLALVGLLALALVVMVGAAFAADPTDTGFGTDGIAEIEAREPGVFINDEQVGGIADLERAKAGKLLAAVYGIARGGHYFAAASIDRDGSLDLGFGEGGFTQPVKFSRAHEENEYGFLEAEAVAQQRNGDVVLAGYFDHDGALAPALARFTPQGRLDPSFGRNGKVVPRPRNEGKLLTVSEVGGERLNDVAVEPKGDIVAAGEIVRGHGFDRRSPKEPAAVVVAYRDDGKVDRGFGHHGRFEIKVPEENAYTGFTEIKALPSGKLLVSGYVHQQIVLYRLTANGRPDPGFGGGDGKVTLGKPTSENGVGFIRAPFAVYPDGRIALSGVVFRNSILDGEPVVLVRFAADGRRDRSFGKSIYLEKAPIDSKEPIPRKHVQQYAIEPQAVAIDGHGRIVVTASELAPYTRGQKEAGYEYFAARRFLPNGRRDRDFGRGGVWATNPAGSESMSRAAATQPDGKIVAGGWVQIERGGGNGPGNTAMLLTRYR